MEKLEFRADGLTGEQSQQWKKLNRPSGLSIGAVASIIAITAVIYTVSPLNIYVFNRPGRIGVIASPPSSGDSSVTVKGTVENPRIESVTLSVNGTPQIVPVNNGAFIAQVPLVSKEVVIQPSVGGVAPDPIRVIRPAPSNISISSSANGDSTYETVITVRGSVAGTPVGTIALRVNESSQTLPLKNGQFESDVSLVRGENTILASVDDVVSNTLKITSRIPPPLIKITSPNPGSSLDNAEATVTGTVQNTEAKSITLDVITQGVNRSSIVVAINNGSFASPVSLGPGENMIRASISESVSDTVKLTLIAAGHIQIAASEIQRSIDKSFVTVTGTLENTQITTVTLNVNKTSKPVSVKDGRFTSRVSLAAGENTIQAVAAGGRSKMIKIIGPAIARKPANEIPVKASATGPEANKNFPLKRPAKKPQSATTIITGDCQGTITVKPTSGYANEPAVITIVIKPPFTSEITRVVTNNPGCPNCEAKPDRAALGRFSLTLPFANSRTKARVEFVAYDKDNKPRCKGYTAELTLLGPRP